MKTYYTPKYFWNSPTARSFRSELRKGNIKEAYRYLKYGIRRFFQIIGGAKSIVSASSDHARRGASYLRAARSSLGRWELLDALLYVNRSIGLLPKNAEAQQLHSFVLEVMGYHDAARSAILASRKLDRLNVRTLRMVRKYGLEIDEPAAIKDVQALVAARKWTAKAVNDGRLCLIELGARTEALELIDTALEQGAFPDETAYALLRGDTLYRLGRFEEALAQVAPVVDGRQSHAEALNIRSMSAFEMGDFEAAEADAVAAIKARSKPGPRGFNNVLFHTRFDRGRCREAFEEHHHRPFTRALKEDIKGNYIQAFDDLKRASSIVVVADYGVGDEIRFASIYPDLAEHFPGATVTCDPRLQTIFSRSFPKLKFLSVERWREEVVVRNPDSRAGVPSQRLTAHISRAALDAIEEADAFTSIFDLLAALRPTPNAFGKRGSYLVANPERVIHWRRRVAAASTRGLPNLALSWRSLLVGHSRNMHYLDVSDMKPLADVQAKWWLFQPGYDEAEFSELRASLGNTSLIDGLDLVDDFEDQAALLCCLDGVVTPGTTLGELAGALGVPTLMFGRTHGARSRLRADGTDLWHPALRGIVSDPIDDAAATVSAIADAIPSLQLAVRSPLAGRGRLRRWLLPFGAK